MIAGATKELTCHLGAHGVRETDIAQLQVASLGRLDGCVPGVRSVGFRSAMPGTCVGSLPPCARWQRRGHRGVWVVRANCFPHSACDTSGLGSVTGGGSQLSFSTLLRCLTRLLRETKDVWLMLCMAFRPLIMRRPLKKRLTVEQAGISTRLVMGHRSVHWIGVTAGM